MQIACLLVSGALLSSRSREVVSEDAKPRAQIFLSIIILRILLYAPNKAWSHLKPIKIIKAAA